MLWEPAIYEHKAALIDRPVWEVARSADLLCEAVVREREVYRADLLTVGLDVYNLEAEACGACVVPAGPSECPEIRIPPWDMGKLPRQLEVPDMTRVGRGGTVLNAAQRARDQIADGCRLRVAASGPVSIAAKLVGLEDLITGLALGNGNADRLLGFATELAEKWCAAIRSAGLEAIVFDSASSPPMVSPRMYDERLSSLHEKLMSDLKRSGQDERPLIIGGDTIPILDALARTGATMLICDYNCDAIRFAETLPSQKLRIRRNADPALFSADDRAVNRAAADLAREMTLFDHPIAGTGILPYRTNPERFWMFRRKVDELIQADHA
jgi:uroporphyrinogen decarboxylase